MAKPYRKRNPFRRKRRRKDFSKLYAHLPEHRRPTLELPVKLHDPKPGFCRLCAEAVAPGPTGRTRTWHDGRKTPDGNEPQCGAEFQEKLAAWRVEWRLQTRTKVAKKEIAGRDGAKCNRCHATKGKGFLWLALDHVLPLKDGGTHDADNLQLLCPPCHTDKTSIEATARAKKRRAAKDEIAA